MNQTTDYKRTDDGGQPLFIAVNERRQDDKAKGDDEVRDLPHAARGRLQKAQALFDEADDDRRDGPVHEPAEKHEHVGKVEL